ncbi:MAG: hypothetical protein EPO08_20900 [Rhodospirillaceae bacterium]|nr:MAG: hypothetical protein EPO08_20900 [Rhodospirillaceae bacterium]
MTTFGFGVQDIATGQSLQLLKQGLPTTQTPVSFVGAGPFVLTGTQFETALQTALVLSGNVGGLPVTVVLPSTTTILSILSNCSPNRSISTLTPFRGTNQTYGSWVSLNIINQNSAQTVNLVAGDASTVLEQVGTPAQAVQTFAIFEVLNEDEIDDALVRVVQDWHLTAQPSPSYQVVQNNFIQNGTAATAYVIQFNVLANSGGAAGQFVYALDPSNQLQISAGVTVLISATISVINGAAGVPLNISINLASSGQVATPLTNVIAGQTTTILNAQAGLVTFSVVYHSVGVSSLQLYMSGHDTAGLTTAIIASPLNFPQLTMTQII